MKKKLYWSLGIMGILIILIFSIFIMPGMKGGSVSNLYLIPVGTISLFHDTYIPAEQVVTGNIAGCTGSPRSADGIVSGYTSNVNAINDYSLEAVRVFSSGITQDLEIRYKRPYQYLIKHETGPGGRTWWVAVQNLTYTRFEPASQTADILPVHDPETCFPPIADPNRLAFPVLFSGSYALSDSGIEMVNGREAYRIDAINYGPGNYFDEGINGSVRIWIDRESWLVTRILARDSAENLKNSFEVKNFTTNTGIPDSEFTITYPEGTKIIHPNQFC